MTKKTPNVIRAIHLKKFDDQHIKIACKLPKHWHIPKALRHLNIQPGDIVGVLAGEGNQKAPVLVLEVCREEIEDTGKAYKPVIKVYARAKETS